MRLCTKKPDFLPNSNFSSFSCEIQFGGKLGKSVLHLALKARSHSAAAAAFFLPQQLDYIVTNGVIHTV